MPLSKDPEKREAQLRNLRPVGGKVTHGATSERKLKPLRDKHRAELLERFPRLDEHRLSLLADLLARCDLARDFIDVRGLMRNTREPQPLLQLLERWERRAWQMLSELQPTKQPVEAPPPMLDHLSDPRVRAASQEFLCTIGYVRERRNAEEGNSSLTPEEVDEKWERFKNAADKWAG